MWATATTGAGSPIRRHGWSGVYLPGSGGLLANANGYLVSLGWGSMGTSRSSETERQAASIADLVVGRLAPLH